MVPAELLLTCWLPPLAQVADISVWVQWLASFYWASTTILTGKHEGPGRALAAARRQGRAGKGRTSAAAHPPPIPVRIPAWNHPCHSLLPASPLPSPSPTAVGYGDIVPWTPLETGVCICVQLLGICFFGALLSSIATLIQRASKAARRSAAWYVLLLWRWRVCVCRGFERGCLGIACMPALLKPRSRQCRHRRACAYLTPKPSPPSTPPPPACPTHVQGPGAAGQVGWHRKVHAAAAGGSGRPEACQALLH